MIQELRWRGVARERQARGSFKGNDGESGGDKKMVYWLMRVTVCEPTVDISSPTLHSVMSHWSLEISHRGSIYTTEMGEHYEDFFVLYFCLPAHHWGKDFCLYSPVPKMQCP